MKLDQIIKNEIVEFRTDELKKTKEEIYKDFYRINFFESVYEFLSAKFEDLDYAEKLAERKHPIHWLYSEWLSADGFFSEDWDDINLYLGQIMEESEEEK